MSQRSNQNSPRANNNQQQKPLTPGSFQANVTGNKKVNASQETKVPVEQNQRPNSVGQGFNPVSNQGPKPEVGQSLKSSESEGGPKTSSAPTTSNGQAVKNNEPLKQIGNLDGSLASQGSELSLVPSIMLLVSQDPPSKEVLAGIERSRYAEDSKPGRKGSNPLQVSNDNDKINISPLKSSLKKGRENMISITGLETIADTSVAIPETILHTVVKDRRTEIVLIAQEVIEVCLDNVFYTEEERIEARSSNVTADNVSRKSYTMSNVEFLKGGLFGEQYTAIGLAERYFAGMIVYIDEVHLIDENDREYTKGEVLDKAIKLASRLETEFGISDEDKVVICSRAHPEQNIALLAALLLGSVIAPVDTEMTFEDFSQIIGIIQPAVVFCDPRCKGAIKLALLDNKIESHMILFSVDHTGLPNGFEKYISDFEFREFTVAKIEDPRTKIAFIIPTMGTTGAPKLCAVTHYAMTTRSHAWKHKILKGSRRLMSWFPLSWFVQSVLCCTCFELPITMVMSGRFSERSACKAINENQVDQVVFGTLFALRLSRHVARIDYDMGCLRAIVIGGATTTPSRMCSIWNSFHYVRIFQCYGCTETGICCLHCVSDSFKMQKKAASSGLVLEGYTLKIVNFDSKKLMPPNHTGLLMVKGEGLFEGYYKNDALTTELVDTNGYFNTGDAGAYSLSDHLYVKGKMVDIVIKNGIVGTCTDVDEFLHRHPNIDEVCTITDGKEVVSFVIKKPEKCVTEQEIRFFLERSNFSDIVMPKRIIFTEYFPRTSIGKVKKHCLRETIFKPFYSYSEVSLV